MTAMRGVLSVAAATVVLGCRVGTPEWQEADGYRWRELRVPRGGEAGFVVVPPSRSGITFQNTATEAQVLENEHVLNGSGVAIGDVNGDGLADIYLARIDGPNALYLNRGRWRFDEVAEAAGVALPDRWSTGVVLADVDGDGDLDLYVASLGGPVSVFLNDGQGTFRDEQVLASGLGSTTMTLADIDGDGTLDLYLANYKLKSARDIFPPEAIAFDRVIVQEGNAYVVRPEFREHYGVRVQRSRVMRYEHGEPDRLFRNVGGRYEDIPFEAGVFLDAAGQPLTEPPRDWGLTARFSDVNGDGHPDLYVANDFESPDRLWLGSGAGRFRLADPVVLRTTSQSSMAVDFADVDLDGHVDFLVADMLDPTARRRKTQTPPVAPDEPELGDVTARPQQPRNTFFANRGDGTFIEAANYAGLVASGWTWSVLFLDIDLDGYEDVFLGNGHAFDYLDSDAQRNLQRLGGSDWRRTRLAYPPLDLPNMAFRNRGDLTFSDQSAAWLRGTEPDVSHGLAAGDLDGDGDLDLVINRLDAPALLYRNESSAARLAVRLSGEVPNTQGIGAVIRVRGGPVPEQRKEITAGGMYQSGSDAAATFATGAADSVTIEVRWRSGRVSTVRAAVGRLYEIRESGAALAATPAPVPSVSALFEDRSTQIRHSHAESEYDDFRRQPLLPYRLSQLGPGVTWFDEDGDGDPDLVLPAGAGGRLAVYRNEGNRWSARFPLPTSALDQSAVVGTTTAAGRLLLVGQMNYEATSPEAADGAAAVLAVGGAGARTAVPGERSTTGPLALADYDGDGDLDLFVGGRVRPGAYPAPAASRLMRNEGGRFVEDGEHQPLFQLVGLVSGAAFSDLDGDGDPDLLLALEWGPIALFRNDGGRFTNVTESVGLHSRTSHWIGVTTGDVDGDGRLDVVATSWGLNTIRAATPERPLRVYYGDFDRNGTMDLVEAQYDPTAGGMAPLGSRVRLAAGIGYLGRTAPTFAAYADAGLPELLGPPFADAAILEVTGLAHVLFLNRGDRFDARELPMEAQLAPASHAAVHDLNGDGHEDVLLTQNFFPTEPETPRYAGGRGLVLLGDGTGRLHPMPGQASGIRAYGDQRGAALADYDGDGRVDVAIAQNAAPTKLYRNVAARRGLRVRLVGPPGNLDAIGAQMRVVYGEERGPVREIKAGAGYWSQDGSVQVLGLKEALQPTGIWVRWPGGGETVRPLDGGEREIVIRMRE